MAKGFNAWLAVLPNTQGWGSSAFAKGFYLFADSENLAINKSFEDRPDKITYGRFLAENTRMSGKQSPGGELTYQFRSDDSIPVFMAHFQKYIGTQLGSTGTSIYTFVPEKSEPDWVGSTWGTGAYTDPSGDMYTVEVLKRYFDTTENNGTNAIHFKSGIVDEIMFEAKTNEDAKIKANFKFYDVTVGTAIGTALNPPNSTYGSYSANNAYRYFSGTFTAFGSTTPTFELKSLTVTSKLNSEEKIVLGKTSPVRYDFGRGEVSGNLELDMPKDGLKYLGSMLSDLTFGVSGTFYGGANDYVVIDMPLCKYEDFTPQIQGGNAITSMSIPFKAYQSNDGGTAPIKVTVRTMGWGSAFDRV